MTELQNLIDRADIEALQTEFTDAATMHDLDRLMALYTEDAVHAVPAADIELSGWEAIRAGTEEMEHAWEFFVQNTHPGSIHVTGDTATGRALVFEIGRQRDGRSVLNHGVFHDGYRRTPEGWKFTERVYEVRYFDPTPLAGSPEVAWDSGDEAAQTNTPA